MKLLGGARFICMMVISLVMCACSTLRPPEYVGALVSTFQSFFQMDLKGLGLKPGFEYIQIEIDGRKTAMALGSREVLMHQGQQQIHERWYSGQREMIHMVDGRLHTAVGLTVEWRQQRSAPPTWEAVVQSKAGLIWQRELDIMPGYRFGHADQMLTRAGRAPPGAPALPADTRWFSDEVRSPQALGGDWVFVQHFAVQQGRVVYSEQCLAPTVCFKFKPLGMVP